MNNATYEQIKLDECLSKEIKLTIVKSFVILYQMTFLHAYFVEISMLYKVTKNAINFVTTNSIISKIALYSI